MPKHSEKNSTENIEALQPRVIAVFALVGMSITAMMGVIGLFNQDILLASILFFASAVYYAGYYVYKKFKRIKLTAAIILYSLYLLMFYLIYSGGTKLTGPLWIFIVAPVSMHIHGLKRGLIDIAIFIIIISLIMFMPASVFTHAMYSTEFKIRLLLSFLSVTFLSAVYEYSREQSYKRTIELSKKYQQLAHFDSLTKLSNRRDALATLKHEQARMLRNNEPLTIVLCDVDRFKQINDHYGHNAGDKVLVELAKLFVSNIREVDNVSRWGGEEFLFIFPQTETKSAHMIAEKIRKKVSKLKISLNHQLVEVTVSMGIEQLNEKQSIDEAINSADKNLYLAKNSGRNQIFPKL